MKAARGFSLVELMIAIVLGMLITDAMVAMFVSVRSASRTTMGVAGLSDSGRFALDSIEQVVRGAGNLACDATSPVSAAGVSLVRVLSAVPAGDALSNDYDQPLAGYEANTTAPGDMISLSATPADDMPTGGWVSTAALGGTLDSALVNPPVPAGQSAPVGTPVAASDILVVHETLPGSKPAYTLAVATGASEFPIGATTAFQGADQIGVISNCVQSEVFQVSGFAPGTLTLDGSLSPDIDFEIGAQVDPVDTIVFYVGIGADGDGALFKYDSEGGLLGGPYAVNEELVPDVENMQILYGIETTGATTAAATRYVTADQVETLSATGDFNGVISVQIALLVASPPGAVPKGAAVVAGPALLGTTWTLSQPDNRIRKVYEQTMFLRNMSP